MTWTNTPHGPRTVVGGTTITICSAPSRIENLYYIYAITTTVPKSARVYLSPSFYLMEAEAQAAAERWVEKQGITQ